MERKSSTRHSNTAISKIAKKFEPSRKLETHKIIPPPPLPLKHRSSFKEPSFGVEDASYYTSDLRINIHDDHGFEVMQPMVFSPSRKAMNLPEYETTQDIHEQLSNARNSPTSQAARLQRIYFGCEPPDSIPVSSKNINRPLPELPNTTTASISHEEKFDLHPSAKTESSEPVVYASNFNLTHLTRNPTLNELLSNEKSLQFNEQKNVSRERKNYRKLQNKQDPDPPSLNGYLSTDSNSIEADSLQAIDENIRKRSEQSRKPKFDKGKSSTVQENQNTTSSNLASRTLLNLRQRQQVKQALKNLENVRESTPIPTLQKPNFGDKRQVRHVIPRASVTPPKEIVKPIDPPENFLPVPPPPPIKIEYPHNTNSNRKRTVVTTENEKRHTPTLTGKTIIKVVYYIYTLRLLEQFKNIILVE